MSGQTTIWAVFWGAILLLGNSVNGKLERPASENYEEADFGRLPVTLPMNAKQTHIMIDGVIVNGKGPFRFLLDTGAMGGGRVDTSLAKKLGLKQTGKVIASDGSGRAGPTMPAYRLDSLTIGSIEYRGVHVISRDYNIHAPAGRDHIDGILGIGLFKDLLLTIDYPSAELRLDKGKLPRPNNEDVIPLIQDAPVPSVKINLAGKNYDARIDTGSMGELSVSSEIASELTFVSKPVEVGEARTVSGPFKLEMAALSGNAWLGKHKFEKPNITIAGPLNDVNLGGRFLRQFEMTLDQMHGRVRFRLPNRIAQPSAARDPNEVAVDLDMATGRPVIEARIDGKGPFRFILDTGAAMTVLHSDLVEELGMRRTGTTRIGDPSAPEAVKADTHIIETVQVGGVAFKDINAVSWKDEMLQQSVGDVRGIIGLPTFAEYVLTFDFAAGKLRLSREPLENDDSVSYRIDRHGMPTLEIDVDGQKVDAHIDTGNPRDLALPKRLMKKLKLRDEPRIAKARTTSGEFEIAIAKLDGTVTIAGQRINDLEVHFTDRFDWGNIGSNILSRFAVTIDQANKRIRLTQAAEIAERPAEGRRVVHQGNAPQRRYGILVAMSSGGPMAVDGTMPGSIAEKAGIKKGDLILSVNGQDIAPLNMADRGALLRESPANLRIKRNGAEIEVKMSLDDPVERLDGAP